VGEKGEGLGAKAFGAQHGDALGVGIQSQHDPFALEILRGGDPGVLPGHDHIGGVLENRGHDHYGLPFLVFDQHRRRGHRKLGLACGQRIEGVDAGLAGEQFDLQPGFPEIALLNRRVVAGKLKLMAPFELQPDVFGDLLGARGAPGAQQRREQAGGQQQEEDRETRRSEAGECWSRSTRKGLTFCCRG